MSRSTNNSKYIAEININPMVGIIFALISVFMIATPIVCGGESVAVPKAINSDEDRNIVKEKAMIVAIPVDGIYFVGKDPVTINKLTDKIREMSQNRNLIDRIVYIKGGTLVSCGSIVDVISAIRKAGIRRIGLVTSKEVYGKENSST